MALSTEAILAIIALFISLPPAVFAFYKVRRLSAPSSRNDYSMLPTILNTPSSDYVLRYTFTERTIEAHLHSISTGGLHAKLFSRELA
ncbi:hypothetical protein BS50DRAFT_570206 [Corynespora cassiicola Philippines]|uniref:Uncharacterized protein n=1 Tax=Corynespora cassiicola Philippines TaxID=1448308 RepID=A0A2T2NZ34_CORCC|nr:hypothetical protein BS50DRAFT_570206 [Corynespora cassiicola Philippines]